MTQRRLANLVLLVSLLAAACTPASIRARRDRERAESDRLGALEALPAGDRAALPGLERIARDATIPAVAARSAMRAGDLHRDAGRPAVASRWWRIAALRDPDGGWGRAAVERLHESWKSLTAKEVEARLRTLRHPALDGMLLYLAAAAHAAATEGRARAVELCLWQRRLTPRSPWRDDCEDLTLSLLGQDDRIRFARALLLPLPSDDPAALDSPRFQRIELNLARDLAAANRGSEAAHHLTRVVDRYPSARLKDDALWLLAKLHRERGEPQQERRALKTLVRNLPHSRYREEAEAIIRSRKNFVHSRSEP